MRNINIDTDGLEKLVASFDEKIKNVSKLFDDIEKKMHMIDGSSNTWCSVAQESVYNNYRTISDDFPVIISQLKNYNNFLKKTVENYKIGEEHINNDINNNEKDLNVN